MMKKENVWHVKAIHSGIVFSLEKGGSWKRKLLPFAKTWINLEDIMVSAVGWAQEDKYGIISLTPEI